MFKYNNTYHTPVLSATRFDIVSNVQQLGNDTEIANQTVQVVRRPILLLDCTEQTDVNPSALELIEYQYSNDYIAVTSSIVLTTGRDEDYINIILNHLNLFTPATLLTYFIIPNWTEDELITNVANTYIRTLNYYTSSVDTIDLLNSGKLYKSTPNEVINIINEHVIATITPTAFYSHVYYNFINNITYY